MRKRYHTLTLTILLCGLCFFSSRSHVRSLTSQSTTERTSAAENVLEANDLSFASPATNDGQDFTLQPTANAVASCEGDTRFAVIGDYGKGNAAEEDVADLVKSWQPDFIVTTGDNNYPDGAASTIDKNIGQYYSDYIYPYSGQYGSGATENRFFPSLGNHDWITAGAQPHLDYFTLPGNERYYDVEQGPVHLFIVDGEPEEPDGNSANSNQAQWLAAQMAASDAPWKIVALHRAPYSSSSYHGSHPNLQWDYAGMGATAVIAGHDHVYERIMTNDILYFVNGLGGATVYQFALVPVAGSAVRYNGDNGAMLISAGSTCIDFSFINRSGDLIDSYTLTSPNEPPNAHSDRDVITMRNTAVTIDVAANDSDSDGNLDPTTTSTTCTGGSSRCSDPANGSLTNLGDGRFEYMPDADFTGSDSFVYEICDSAQLCDTAKVYITVELPPPSPPVANDDVASTQIDMPLIIDVAANDSDVDGDLDPASANTNCTGCSTPASGILVNNGDGSFMYTPDPLFSGSDGFVYEICDTGAPSLCDTATVAVTVYEPAEAAFGATPTGGMAPLTVTFENLSSGDYGSCLWEFGDGTTSDLCDGPSHTYTSAGAYTVSLTIDGAASTDSVSMPSFITVEMAESYHLFVPVVLK